MQVKYHGRYDWFGLRQIVSGDDGGHESVIELAEIVASDIVAVAAADVADVATCVVGERAGRKVLLASVFVHRT